MPAANHVAAAGIIAVSVAVAAAIAVYESPELRRMAEDLRRRIAIALHSLGDNINPNDPMFNRPEDAEGFMQSRGVVGDGVEADEESRRRQREELMYWNAVLLEKQEKARQEGEKSAQGSGVLREKSPAQGSTFDDFLQQDKSAEGGTFVFNTGSNVHGDAEGLLRRRGPEPGYRGLNASILANPFADEHGIDTDEHTSIIAPSKDGSMSDIYNATERDLPTAASRTLSPPQPSEVLFDFNEAEEPRPELQASTTLERDLADDEFMTAGQEDRHDAYASIQAWAQNSTSGFYSPLPVSPAAPLSEPEVISTGALTPTDSASVAGSGVDVANDAASSRADNEARYYDVMSEDEDGIATPASWTEVGSVVSESDGAVHA